VEIDEITGHVVDAAMKVHTALGPGLLESVYERCLVHELVKRGLRVRTQVWLPIVYDGITIEGGYKLDLLVEDEVIVELKVADRIMEIHRAQLLSHLRLARKRVGLLINFNEVHLKDGIRRLVGRVDPEGTAGKGAGQP
jgi:GxxExxY protein